MNDSRSADRATQLRHLFDQAVALDPEERAAFLEQACGNDEPLRHELETLLDAFDQADEVLHKLERPSRLAPLSSASSDPERWERVRVLFKQVVALPSDERPAFLEQACADDPALRRELETLLKADAQAGITEAFADVLQQPLVWFSEQPALTEGQHVAHYQIVEQLGAGGMGLVYKARDTKLGRHVALKFLPPHLRVNNDAQQRFIHEAKAASALDHPNICTIFEIGQTEDGRLFTAMAYYQGETLKEKIARGPLSIEDALSYTVQLAEGLQRAHDAEIVHRDVKPANVMITQHNRVKVLDFGIAKVVDQNLTRPGALLGTVAYMSPEQTQSDEVDGRTDLWALGVLLFEMLTGRQPFRRATPEGTLLAIRHDAAPAITALRPETPAALAHVLATLLQKDPEDRYPDAEALLADLHPLLHPRDQTTARLRKRGRSRLLVPGIAVLLLVLFAALALLSRPTEQAGGIHSIAVLPLVNRSDTPDQEYLADGLTEALITELAQIEALRVISRTSAMQFKNGNQPIPEIARKLGVDAVVEGSVMATGDAVRIDVRLIHGQTDQTLWTNNYERPMRNVLDLQRAVTLAIAGEIKAELTPRDEARLGETHPVDPDAFTLYLQGLQLRYKDTHENLQQAATLFEQAIEKDPGFSLAYARLASVYTVLGAFSPLFSREDGEARARRAVEAALALDPNLPDAHLALGLIRELFDWDWDGAEQAFRRAIALNPGDSEAHYELGLLLTRLGRAEEAVRAMRRAVEHDPLASLRHYGLAQAYLYGDQYEQALQKARDVLALDSTFEYVHMIFGHAYLKQGRLEEAAVELIDKRKLDETTNPFPLSDAGHIYGVLGRREEAMKIIDALKAQWARGINGSAYSLAVVYAGLDEPEEACLWLETSFANRSPVMLYLNIEPTLDPLHNAPCFHALREKMNLK